MNDDGYPEDAELEQIRTWSPGPKWSGSEPWLGILGLVYDAWNHDMGRADWSGQILTLVTGGWSGNEEVLGALEDNRCARSMLWLSSHRGGRYTFGIKDQEREDRLTGPGTPTARFHWTLDELEKRFPMPSWVSVSSSGTAEQYYLSRIDAHLRVFHKMGMKLLDVEGL